MTVPAIAYGDPIVPGAQPRSVAAGLLGGSEIFPAGGFAFIGADGSSSSVAYAEVLSQARRYVGGLRRHGVRPGDKVVLHFQDCAAFIPVLWATLLAGAIPLPMMRNEWNRGVSARTPQLLAHLRTILDRPRIITDGTEHLAAFGIDAGDTIALPALDSGKADEDFVEGALDDPCLLVLTSGTTATPNIVTLSGRAVVNRWWPSLPDPNHAVTFLSWSPFEHVMGLGLASPNLPAKVHLATNAFVRSPESWLSALDRHRVTHCTMTNFGMALVERAAVDAAAAGRSWDLSSVRKIGVGAEAVSPALCSRFLSALQGFGLRSDAIILGYGLSECGPVVGGGKPFSAAGGKPSPFAPLDRPTRGHAVRIVADAGVLREGEIGAVEVRGPTMALGYLGNQDATRALFTDDGWIRTGDLGRLDDGCLTITGREKEIVIINARKYSCFEIEMVAQEVDGVGEAFAVSLGPPENAARSDPGEEFAIFVVPAPSSTVDPDILFGRLREKLSSTFGKAPARLVPIAEDDVSRTATGKVRRTGLAEGLRTGAFDRGRASGARPAETAGVGPFASETETKIAAIWTDILGPTNFGRDDDFFAVGGDSLAIELLIMAIEHAFATRLSPEMFQQNTTIAGLAAFVDGTRTAGGSGKPGSNVAAFIGASGDQRPTATTMADVAPPRNGQRLRNRENLAWALEIARAFTPSVRESLAAADLLVASGMTGKADLLLHRIVREFEAQVRPVMTFLSRLIAVNARFRRTGIEQRVGKLGELGEWLSSPGEESVLWAPRRSQKLLVVFTTMYDDFWVSCPVLHCILQDCGANILYLKDPRRSLYLRGLRSFGDSFEALVDGIGRTARQTGARDIRIMGHSSGGYAGLLAASRLDAATFLGFSIRTDLAPDSPMPGTRFAKEIDGEAAGLLLDLKSIVTDRGAPRRAVLYCGEGDTGDVAHAEHMADLPNFLVKKVAMTRHETVLALLADGEFERAVRRFLR